MGLDLCSRGAKQDIRHTFFSYFVKKTLDSLAAHFELNKKFDTHSGP